jgi:hypothetical protein
MDGPQVSHFIKFFSDERPSARWSIQTKTQP